MRYRISLIRDNDPGFISWDSSSVTLNSAGPVSQHLIPLRPAAPLPYCRGRIHIISRITMVLYLFLVVMCIAIGYAYILDGVYGSWITDSLCLLSAYNWGGELSCCACRLYLCVCVYFAVLYMLRPLRRIAGVKCTWYKYDWWIQIR